MRRKADNASEAPRSDLRDGGVIPHGREGTPRVAQHRYCRWIVIAGLCLAGPASAGVIRGVLRVPPSAVAHSQPMNPYPGHAGAMPGMHAVERGRVTDAVVYVEQIPAPVDSALAVALAAGPGSRPQLAQMNEAFVPRVVAVAVGSSVDFPNRDPIYHNVFSLSSTRRFDLGKYPRGHSKSVAFDHVGLVNVYCDIHSEMEAFVLVLPHHAFAQPNADGAFELPALPPGRYRLHVWHPDLTDIVRAVEIPAQGDTSIELSF